MQIAILYTGRRKFLSVEGSYHGNPIGALSIGDSENREQFKYLLPNCIKIKPPLDDKAADKVDARLKNKDIAALIMEPVICNPGVVIPEADMAGWLFHFDGWLFMHQLLPDQSATRLQ